MEKNLICNAQGDFKILIVADPHCESLSQWQEAGDELETLVAKTEPDFVLINGDMETNNNVPADGWDSFIKPLTTRGIYWSTTNGNHDPFDEKVYQLYKGYGECLNAKVDEDNGNYDFERPMNYRIPVYANDGKRVVFAIYGMDSGTNNKNGWDGFTEKQIQWYIERSEELKALNGGIPVTSLLCCHLPFTEVYDMEILHGVINENINATAVENNRNFFDTVKKQGDVKIAVFGHMHTCNQVGVYKGIVLAYAGKVSSASFHDESARGGRLIQFNQSNPEKFATSWISSLSASAEQPQVCLQDEAEF